MSGVTDALCDGSGLAYWQVCRNLEQNPHEGRTLSHLAFLCLPYRINHLWEAEMVDCV
jgi:hypothetical protein